jgi:hypothetical protein
MKYQTSSLIVIALASLGFCMLMQYSSSSRAMEESNEAVARALEHADKVMTSHWASHWAQSAAAAKNRNLHGMEGAGTALQGPSVPWTTLVAEHLGNVHKIHGYTSQDYEFEHDEHAPSRRRLSSHRQSKSRFLEDLEKEEKENKGFLTEETTERLKIKFNSDALDSATARPFSTCFAVGDWYYTGPEKNMKPPKDGIVTCKECTMATLYTCSKSCWGKCESDDVMTPELKEYLMGPLLQAKIQLESLLRVPKLKTPLKLSKKKGTYTALYSGWGYDTEKEVCSADTYYLCQTKSPASYCEQGMLGGENAIVYLTYTPVLFGGGTGGPCEYDQLGRPITMAYNIKMSQKKMKKQFDSGYNPKQTNEIGVAAHEILHGLGFSINMFQDRNIVQSLPAYEGKGGTGKSDDTLWWFNKDTITSKFAKVHFDCQDDTKWQGLPLMGRVEGGGPSHHNSFVLLEATESYGFVFKNTVFDYAPFEDLGIYLVNYSNCDYPDYGAYQGCDFVNTRCRSRRTIEEGTPIFNVVSSNDECNRQFP